jgi:hypothetical protein
MRAAAARTYGSGMDAKSWRDIVFGLLSRQHEEYDLREKIAQSRRKVKNYARR